MTRSFGFGSDYYRLKNDPPRVREDDVRPEHESSRKMEEHGWSEVEPDHRRLKSWSDFLRFVSYFDNWYSAAFLEALVKELAGQVVVVWDGGGTHQGDLIGALQDVMADRLSIEKLPPYAPTLNPAEPVWSWLKWGQLSNFAPDNATHLNERVVSELTAIQDDQEALRGFWKTSELPLPRALFS